MSAKDLERKIREAREAYYNDEPIMSDFTFDNLVDRLRKIKPKSKVLTEVGAKPKGAVMPHKIPMGSLGKVDDMAELRAWLDNAWPVVVMDKLDGCSIGLEYKNGKLVRALTRGNGMKGEDITANARLMQNVKKTIKGFTGFLRGEAMLRKDVFAEKYAADYANPRNTTSGTMRRHSGEGAEDLEVIFFRMTNGKKFKSFSAMFTEMRRLGLTTVRAKKCNSGQMIFETYKEWEAGRADYAHECDGVVVAIDKTSARPEGDPMRPSNQIAFKFPPDVVRTTVKKITWEASRTGRVNPVVWVRPVTVAGVTVSKATGNNFGWMKEMGIGEKSTVKVSRRGDVIPAVEEVLRKGKVLRKPKKCPACASGLETVGAYLMCLNEKCPEKRKGLLQHWVRLIDIKGLGPSNIDKLIKEAKFNTPADFYDLEKDEYEIVLGKNGAKVFRELQAKKDNIPLDRVFAAFIPNVGTRRFQALMRAGFDTPEKLLLLETDDLLDLPGFSTELARRITDGMFTWKEDITELLFHITVAKPKKVKKGAPLSGMGIKFTGKMVHKRTVLEAQAAEAGAEITWRKDLTNVLVIADPSSNSGKAKTAKQKGYEIWTPEEFLKKIK